MGRSRSLLRWVPLIAKSISLQNQKTRKEQQNVAARHIEKSRRPAGVKHPRKLLVMGQFTGNLAPST